MEIKRKVTVLFSVMYILSSVTIIISPVFSGPPYYHEEGNVNYPGSYYESVYIEKGIGVDDYITIMDGVLMVMAMGTDEYWPWGVGWDLYNPDADFNGDRRVNVDDHTTWLVNLMLNYHDPPAENPKPKVRTKVKVDTPTQPVHVGNVFSIDITIKDVEALWLYELKLNWNSSFMTAIYVVEGDFFESQGIQTTFYYKIFTDYLYVGSLPSPEYPPNTGSGSGILCTVYFNCTGTGTPPKSTIYLSSGLYGINLDSITHSDHNGEVIQRP